MHGHTRKPRDTLLESGPQHGFALFELGIRHDEPLAARAASRSRDPRQVVDRCGHGREVFVWQGAELEALRHRVAGWQQLIWQQRFKQHGVGHQYPQMRAEKLVWRAAEEIGAQRGDIDRGVRRVVNTVDIDERTDGVGEPGDFGDRRHRSDQIGCRGHRDQAGAVAKQRRNILDR